MDWSKLWPSLASLVMMLTTAFSDQILSWISQHPALAMAISQVLTTIANLVKSPAQPPQA